MVTTPDIFAARLFQAAASAELRADELERRWGDRTAEEMRRRVPVRTGRLRDSIRQTEPGVVEVGVDYGVYVDRGTSRMPPQEFVRPSLNSVLPQVEKEGLEAGVDWI
ncbi:MAG TPA: HK97-gp10 family putative phage morphogenesis protein [Acidimicrobiia bacterium]